MRLFVDVIEFDYIVVGAGSAGCVMANRLSHDVRNRVLLCEAGPDLPDDNIPPAILDSYPGTAYLDPRFLWSELRVSTEARPRGANTQPTLRKYEQARVMGGGSSINGQFFNRGGPSDYDEWHARGATGWNWGQVLPFFRKIENDLDFDGELHGKDGRIPVRRIFPEFWPGHAKAIAKGLEQLGWNYLPDQNGVFEDGYFPIAISNRNEQRVSAAIGYLDAATRRRPNLTIWPDTQVTRLLFDGTTCTGVTAMGPRGERNVTAREVVLSAGALASPAILLRSGIGPALHLRGHGIGVVVDLPGVGQHLMEHPSIALASFIRRGARINRHTRRHIMLGWRYSSGLCDAPPGDMFVSAVTKSSWHAVGECIGTLLTYVNKPYSATGEVTLSSPDWRTPPRVDFNLLSDERDMVRLKYGFRQMAALQATDALRAVTDQPFPASYGEKVRQVAMLSRRNKFVTDVLAKLLDGPAVLRRTLMRKVVAGGPTLAELLADDDVLQRFIARACVGVWHPGCTCRMGPDDDPGSVTDSWGRVRGAAGLRVADASIFPTLPSGNLNFPTMMVAERIAEAMVTQPTS